MVSELSTNQRFGAFAKGRQNDGGAKGRQKQKDTDESWRPK